MSDGNVLSHVALIPDGTRRWARNNGVSLSEAYQQVSRVLVALSDVVYRHGARSLSIYALSKNNLSRTADDLAVTYASHVRIFRDVLPDMVAQWGAHVFHAGDPHCLPSEYMKALTDVCRSSYETDGTREIYVCAGYSAEWELRTSGRPMVTHKTRSNITRYVPYDVYMMIRTGGELRLSGFLPLQLQYAELFFVEKLFPDITADDVEDAIAEYYSRDRRFGG